MQSLLAAQADPWRIEILVVRNASHSGGERREYSRDVERGLLIRLAEGAYVARSAFDPMTPEEQHVARMRALTAVSDRPPVFSHWSAGVLHGLPVPREHLRSVHITVPAAGGRGRRNVTGHVFHLDPSAVIRIGDLLTTSIGRTVVDVAGSGPFDDGVMAADAALHRGLPRSALEAAADLVGPRNAMTRIGAVIAFADPGAESAAESRSRVTMYRIGTEPPLLQHRVRLATGGDAYLDFLFPSVHVGGEADGDVKFLDPRLAPNGAGRALIAEKRREDDLRAGLHGLARWGWAASINIALLRGVLGRAGVLPRVPRATLSDFCARAREGRPR